MQRRNFVLAGAAALPLAAAAGSMAAAAPTRGIRVLVTPLANAELFPAAPVPAAGAALALRREPGRRFDPASVAVADAAGNRLGYLPPIAAGTLAALMDAGVPARARIAPAAGALTVEVFVDLPEAPVA